MISVALMAGGKSSRMGMDKAFVELNGKPMIEHLLARVADLGQVETFIISNKPDDYRHISLPIYTDVLPDQGSLGGIYTAVHYSRSHYTLVVACDMPFVSPELLRYMIGLADGTLDVIVPRVEKFPQGLFAIYSKNCLEPIRRKIDAGRLKVIRFYSDVQVRYLDEPEYEPYDPTRLSFFNVNTPEDLRHAQRLLASD